MTVLTWVIIFAWIALAFLVLLRVGRRLALRRAERFAQGHPRAPK